MLVFVKRDATQRLLFCIAQVHSTCFRCQTHLLSGVHKTVNTASITGQARQASSRWRTLAVLQKYDQYRRVFLQFIVIQMIGVVDS